MYERDCYTFNKLSVRPSYVVMNTQLLMKVNALKFILEII